jgi:hypothetical protein
MITADDIILELIATGRQATMNEIDTIIAHVAQAPFATYLARVPNKLRALLAAQGIQVSAKLPSVEWHLLKRVYEEHQWPAGTTVGVYVDDLHRAVRHPDVRLWTYRYYNRPYAGFMAPSHVQAVLKPLAFIYVAYDPRFSTITTGYQASSVGTIFDQNCTDIVYHR